MNKRHLLLMVWVIVFLILSNLISLYFLLQPGSGSPKFTPGQQLQYLDQIKAPYFKQPMDDSAGKKNVEAYRKYAVWRSYGVLYDADTIQNYLTHVYPDLKRKMGRDTTGHTWKIGFYWMITKGKDSANRLSFCVVPTLVSKTDPSKAIDYFNDSTGRYNHWQKPPPPPAGSTARVLSDSGFVYNEGQLWP